MLQSHPKKLLPVSWDTFHRDARALAWRLGDLGPFQAIICMTRGGLVPAAIVARELNLRLIETVCVTSYSAPGIQGKLELLKPPAERIIAMGFFNVGVFAYKEWQHDGFASTFPFQPIPNPSGKVEFDPTWAVEINYSQPLGFLPPWLPLKYKALVVIHGPKGCGETCQPLGPGLTRTTEYLTQQVLVFDLGQV